MACNGRACCCAGIQRTSSPTVRPIELQKFKLTTKSQIEKRLTETGADSEKKDENLFVCQHRSKPLVARPCFVTRPNI